MQAELGVGWAGLVAVRVATKCCCSALSRASTYPSSYLSKPANPPLQVTVELEGEGRPRRLSVVIRRVDIIPIRSLQARLAG